MELKESDNVQLDIFFPYQFVKDTLAAHDSDKASNMAFPWISWENKILGNKNGIVTQTINDECNKLLLISVKSVNFMLTDGKVSFKFREIERDNSSSVWNDINACNNASAELSIQNATNANDVQQNSSSQNMPPLPVKRKRGRPKKSEIKDKESKTDDLTVKDELKCEVTNTGSRYGLRGVKLSQAIMRAEKGLYFDSSNDKKFPQAKSLESDIASQNVTFRSENDTNPNTESVDQNVAESVPESLQNAENTCDNAVFEQTKNEEKITDFEDGCWEEILEDEEQYCKKRKRGRPRKVRSSNGTSQKKLKHKIDLGDIPSFKRRKRNTKKKGECKYCNKQFCDYTGVDAHVRKFHSNESDFETYLESIKDLKVEICSHCGEKFDNRVLLQVHENRAHFRNQPVQCNKCKKMYKNVLSLRNHIVAVHTVKGQPHLCHLCPAKFKWAMTLKQHIAEIHDGKLDYVCKFCKKAFSRKAQLKRHERIHGVDQSKKLICPICNKGFWYDCNLQRHLKLVHGPHKESHHCSYCGKGFNMKSAMVNHVQHVHLNIHAFKCSRCNLGFRRRRLLEDHMIDTHKEVFKLKDVNRVRYKYGRSSEDLFYCSYCSLSFCYKTKMIEHMHIDHGKEFPFVCEHCSQGFMERSFLLNHLRKAHDVEVDESDEQSIASMVGPADSHHCKIATLEIPAAASIDQSNKEVVTDAQQKLTTVVDDVPGEISDVDTDAQAASVLLEVANGGSTIHYLIQQPKDGGPTVIPTELSSLLLAAEIRENGELELTCDGDGYTYLTKTENIAADDDVTVETISSNIIVQNVDEDEN